MKRKEITNIFGWLNEITLVKSPTSTFTDKEWEVWNSYLIHRFLSMNKNYVEIVNQIQNFPPTDKKQIYTIYKEFIPKSKVWLKYIKPRTKPFPKPLLESLSEYFKCSIREAEDYMRVLSSVEVEEILCNLGLDKKEIKKLKK